MKYLPSKINDQPIWPLYLLFFTSVDTVLFGTNGNRAFVLVPRIVALLYIIFISIIVRKGEKNKKGLIACFILCSILSLSIWINEVEFLTLTSRLLFIVTAYKITSSYKFVDYITAFDNFLYFISIVALCTFAASYTIPSVFSLFFQILNENNLAISTYFIGSIQISQLGETLKRMNGIFWEPGAYAIYLCIGIIYQLFYRIKTDKKRFLIYIAAIITTFSTTGIIGLSMVIMTYLSGKQRTNNKSVRLLLILVMILTFSLFSLGYVDALYKMFFSKIANNDPTTIVRYSSLINGFQIAWDNPFLGVGGKSEEYMPIYALNYGYGANKMLTNTWVYQFANYGFIFGIIFTIGTFNFFKKTIQSGLQAFLLFIVLLLLYVGECFFSFIPFIFVFYGYKQIRYENSRH